MATQYMKDKPTAEDFAYAYAETADGALVRVPKNKVTGEGVTVDSALSETSTNPVQNKVVAEKLKENLTSAKEYTDGKIPTALKNPNPLTFTGAVTGSYDGSEKVNIEIPSGGSSGGLGVTTAQANSLWAIIQKASFVEPPTDEELNALKTAWGIDAVQVTLSRISATYSGGNVTVGTDLTALTGITVNATYSDGSTINVTDYTLSGEIVEGSNTITVTYGGLTTTFEVVGVAVPLYSFESADNIRVLNRYSNISLPAYITITDGNHVKVESETGGNTIWYLNVNISSLVTNGQDATALIGTWFTVPQNAELKLKLSNVTYTSGTYESICGVRASDGTTLISCGVSDNTITGTTTGETAVTCLQMNLMLNGENSAVEFDVEFWVNGERWI